MSRTSNQFATSPSNYGQIIDEDRIIDLSFDKNTNRLTFKIQHYHLEPKISRYVQRNYERIPIYNGEYSKRTRLVKNFNKVINPIKFVNEDILNLQLEKEFILKIIKEIGIVPAWREKELEIEKLKRKVENLKVLLRSYDSEKKYYVYKPTNYPMEPGNFWLRLVLVPFTFGFSFKNYVSKTKAKENILTNQTNDEWNQVHKAEIDALNEELKKTIETNNAQVSKKIAALQKSIEAVKAKEITYEKTYDDGWTSLKDGSYAHYPQLQNQMGVYIIWNKTKNKYYVGQSKNVKTGLLNNFKDGEPKNIIFAKDWMDGDDFVYKCHFCETKDELDALKKRYIEEYFAFENGYNKTRGSI